jgi:hypothetical protein
VDYEDSPPNRFSEGVIIYHCRDCGFTQKEVTGREMVIGDKISHPSFKQKIDAHYRVDDKLREEWNNPR